MKLIIEQDDIVYDLATDRKGVVQSVYRDLGKAIVKFSDSTDKVSIDNLVVLDNQQDDNSEVENDKGFIEKLIDKIKGKND